MRLAIAVLLWCTVCTQPVLAGAWLREHKSAFVSFGTTVRGSRTVPPEYETKAYAEYGLGPKLTLGFDFNDTRDKSGHALLFLRFPLLTGRTHMRYAVELGLGGHHWQGQWSPMYKLAFATGRGFESRWGNGWLAAEAAIEQRDGQDDPTYKLDAVAGLSSGPRIRPMIKLETAYSPGQPFGWTLTPGILFDVGESTWVLGIERRSGFRNTVGFSFNLWRNF